MLKVVTMNGKWMAVAAALLVLAAPVSARQLGVVHGVDFDAVPWPEFCAGTAAVPVERGGGRCEVSHPASEYHGTFRDFTGRNHNPPPVCEIAAVQFRRWTTPVEKSGDPWHLCRGAWARALNDRASEPKRFGDSLGEWRGRFFGRWLVGGAE
jgi:hypothetical protein